MSPNWGLQNNYHSASNGRIWMLWDTSIYILDKLREDTQLLHYQITMKSTGITCVLTVIYGYNTCEQMRTLWDALKEIAQGVTIPWLICGYFNVKGECYTWTNKQQSSDRICSRLDRAFGNHDWMMQWGHVVMEYDLEKWSLIEESIMRHKLRVKWIQLGDSKTKYFSVVVKERNQKKHIREITSLNGVKLIEPKDIQDEIVKFYKSLMGSIFQRLPAINRLNMKRGPTLSQQ
ncbi:uncharacterized protein LOC142165723 [Nicotiana tabacum]|uniref:Uncharacterized protein LOC142165723 n=1 Tax=Nicotiana tabacum TaxID=4097 RepID=A0AC58S5L3_TOBAC